MAARQKKPVWIGPSEGILQIQVAQYLDLMSRSGSFYWFHVPNGGYRPGRGGKTLKAQGVKAGVWDCLLIGQGALLYFIELKCGSRRRHRNGGLSPEQMAFKDKLNGLGVVPSHFVRADTLDQVVDALKNWELIR